MFVEQLDLPAGRERPGVEQRLHDQPEREGQRPLGEAVRVARAQVPEPLGVGDQGAEPLPAAPVLARVGGAQAGVGEIGCWLEPAAEGHGLVTRACETLLDWAFGARGLHRAEWRCRADNTRSSAVAERLGMVREGVLREYWPYDGARYDKEIWAILAPEWTERRR